MNDTSLISRTSTGLTSEESDSVNIDNASYKNKNDFLHLIVIDDLLEADVFTVLPFDDPERSDDELSKDIFENEKRFHLPYPLYKTRAHREMFSILLNQCSNLSKNNFQYKHGICSSTVVGAKGIGKTMSMKTAAIAVRYF
jgi:hypothetical protein